MADEAKTLRRGLARMERGRGKRYSADLKGRIVRWAAKRHAGGASWATISGELGLGLETIRRWVLAAAPAKPALSRALVPVQIAQPSTPTATGERCGLAHRRPHRVGGGRCRPRALVILGTSRAVRVFAYPEPVDLRKGYDGLFGLVKTGLGRDPLSGDLFLFCNRRRHACKVLVWDGTGLCILMKRLERGRFASLWRDDGKSVSLTSTELALFIEGCDLVGRRALSPSIVKPIPLALDRAV